jgi:aryl-alcohol dehydrogenase-like predicted oxidoreductase
MRGFDDLVRQGKILHAGISDAPAWWIAQANTLAELRGWTRFAGIQVEYSLIERTVERELLPMARALHLGVTAWSPLAGGWLSGKYAAGNKSGGRLDAGQLRNNALKIDERAKAIVLEVAATAAEIGRSPAQVALAWLRHRATLVVPIVGAREIAQLKDNLASLEIQLSTDQLAKLNEVSKIEMGFPHDFFDREMVQAYAFGGMKDAIDAA